jgi:hypothetical protein
MPRSTTEINKHLADSFSFFKPCVQGCVSMMEDNIGFSTIFWDADLLHFTHRQFVLSFEADRPVARDCTSSIRRYMSINVEDIYAKTPLSHLLHPISKRQSQIYTHNNLIKALLSIHQPNRCRWPLQENPRPPPSHHSDRINLPLSSQFSASPLQRCHNLRSHGGKLDCNSLHDAESHPH